ncbi:MAG: DUF3450 domain-containing protein [Pontibacterium sp.]
MFRITVPAMAFMLFMATGLFANSASANDLDKASQQVATQHQKNSQAQRQIDALDESTRDATNDYLANERLAALTEAYNAQMEVLVQSQDQELADLQAQIASLDETEKAVLPMLTDMVTMLARFVEHDTPFLLQERHARLEKLQALLARADVSIAEKYRQILQAYAVEIQYGRTFGAYQGALPEADKQVTFLRLGRAALYYQSLNGKQGAYWVPAQQTWKMLSDQQNLSLRKAIQVAQQQAVPELLNLPIPAMGQ